MDLNSKFLQLSIDLYDNKDFTITNVQQIIEIIQNFIRDTYKPHIAPQPLFNFDGIINKDAAPKINNIFALKIKVYPY